MLSEREILGLKNLVFAILNSGIKDASAGWLPERVMVFARSEWCEMLCGMVGISWRAYKREISRRIEDFVEQAKIRRLRTYELVEVLKNGKDTRTSQTESCTEIPRHE